MNSTIPNRLPAHADSQAIATGAASGTPAARMVAMPAVVPTAALTAATVENRRRCERRGSFGNGPIQRAASRTTSRAWSDAKIPTKAAAGTLVRSGRKPL